jgi:iron complex outermembrane receptor protein
VETANDLTLMLNGAKANWKLHIGCNTSYVIATTVSSYIYNDGSVGKQIPYTPRYNGQLNIGFTCRMGRMEPEIAEIRLEKSNGKQKELSFNYNHTYTGYRFTTTDESAYIVPYQTGNVQLMFKTQVRAYPVELIGACNNIWNTRYEVVDQRPMPGTNWTAGLRLTLQ